jgi:acetyl esterase
MNSLEVPLNKTARPDAEARRLLMQLQLAGSPDAGSLSLAKVRRAWQLCVKAFATRRRVAAVRQMAMPSGGRQLALRVYQGKHADEASPALVWFHGGGFVFGDLYTAGATCRAIASRTGATVVAVDYGLVPEHSMEQARDDCIAATRWVFEHAVEIGVDPTRIAVGGDSAGGALAALVAHDLHHAEPQQRLAAQVLIYPATDLARPKPSLDDAVPVLTTTHVAWLRAQIALVSDESDPRLSPLRQSDFARLPPTVMVTAGFDPLLQEAEDYAWAVARAGVPVHLLHYPGQFHGFMSFDRVLVGAGDALDRVCRALSAVFAGGEISTGAERVSVSFRRALRRPLWLKPSQRWNELTVTCLMFRSFWQGLQWTQRPVVLAIAPSTPAAPGAHASAAGEGGARQASA